MRTVDLIEKKRDGGELSTEISYLINGYVSGKIELPDNYTGDGNLLSEYVYWWNPWFDHWYGTSGEQYDLSEFQVLR